MCVLSGYLGGEVSLKRKGEGAGHFRYVFRQSVGVGVLDLS